MHLFKGPVLGQMTERIDRDEKSPQLAGFEPTKGYKACALPLCYHFHSISKWLHVDLKVNILQ